MTMECSPELADMVRRCALPITITCEWDIPCWWIFTPDFFLLPMDRDEAVGTYFRLVSTLTNPGAPSLAGPSDGCSAISEGGM